MKKRSIVLIIIILALAVPLGNVILRYRHRLYCQQVQAEYIRDAKQHLIKLANDPVATREHVQRIKAKPNCWTDRTVGVTRDGYVFYYYLFDVHLMDYTDENIFYLPDEHRFITRHDHICSGIGCITQPKNKAELLTILQSKAPQKW